MNDRLIIRVFMRKSVYLLPTTALHVFRPIVDDRYWFVTHCGVEWGIRHIKTAHDV